MRMPGFAAEKSLSEATVRHRSKDGHAHAEQIIGAVRPAGWADDLMISTGKRCIPIVWRACVFNPNFGWSCVPIPGCLYL